MIPLWEANSGVFLPPPGCEAASSQDSAPGVLRRVEEHHQLASDHALQLHTPEGTVTIARRLAL